MGKRLYENCICGILKSKTVVLVTHHISLISSNESTQVIVLKEGRVAATGPFADVKQHLDWEYKSGFDLDQHDKDIKPAKKADPAVANGVINK